MMKTARPCSPRAWFFGCASLCTMTFVSAATPPAPPPAPLSVPAPELLASAAVPQPAAPAADPMDEPLRLVREAQRAYEQVQDYSCMLIKKEKLGGQPPVENVISMRVRVRPFGVNLRWLEPKALAGQEACYVAGKNDGKMRVKSSGVLGAVGFISLDADDALAKQTSRHSIKEAGIGNLIDRYASGWENERRWNLTQVRIGDYEYNKRRCVRVETVHTQNSDGRFLYARNVLYFDKETKLPVRCECYDWPRRDGDVSELSEVYSYVNMQFNVGLKGDVFDK